MNTSILAPWRDVAIVLLVIEAFVIALAPGIVFFFILKGVRAVKRWLRLPLLNAQMWAQRIQHGTTRAANAVANVPISIASDATRASVTTRGIIDYLLGR